MRTPVALQATEYGMPRHPEYVYRVSGQWKGWDNLFGRTDNYHKAQDETEDEYWQAVKDLPEPQRAIEWSNRFGK